MLALVERLPVENVPIVEPPKTEKCSPRGEPLVAHYNYNTQESIKENTASPADKCLQGSVAEPPAPTDPRLAAGMQHITLKQALQAASERFRERLPLKNRPLDWNDVTEAAYALRLALHISQASWAAACAVLGREGAAICLLLTDRAALRGENPIERPAAYFRGLINKAGRGELRLHNSIFGLLSRSETEKLS
jgi:hypothetical protein